MPVIYKLIAKIIANHIKDTLLGGIHINQMEHVKYTKQDVFIMQIYIEKAFDFIQWDFVATTMVKLEFGLKMSQQI